jgi:hypothetical protein
MKTVEVYLLHVLRSFGNLTYEQDVEPLRSNLANVNIGRPR